MASSDDVREGLRNTIDKLDRQIDTAIDRTVDLHRSGADPDVLLAETALAVGAAKALERLTGVSWEERLEAKALDHPEDGTSPATPGSESGSPAGARSKRFRRRKRRSVTA